VKVWITNYVLTQGIQEMEAEEPDPRYHGMIVVKGDRSAGHYDQSFHGEGKDWHRTEQGARDRANRMVRDKIASVKKQLGKLEKLKF
jgi:hypothetical protein